MARDADQLERVEIADKRGVRWSALDELPGWLPARDTPGEFMHGTFLGEVKHLVQDIHIGGALFVTPIRGDKPLVRFDEFLCSIWWPASITRPPRKVRFFSAHFGNTKHLSSPFQVCEGSPKADQWRNLSAVLVVALYNAWQVDGVIPDEQAPVPRRKSRAAKTLAGKEALVRQRLYEHLSKQPDTTPDDLEAASNVKMDRNLRSHFNAALEHATAVRLWATHNITPHDAQRAQECHGRACRSWARMFCHLTPNFHLSEHNIDNILRLGPFPSWWGFPFEQFNGFLKRFKNNGHTGGQLELTMMRGWWKYTLLSDLVRQILSVSAATDSILLDL